MLCLSIFALSFSCDGPKQETNTKSSQVSDGMLQHTVFFYLNDSITTSEKSAFEDGLKQLLAIDVIHQSEMGKTAATPTREVADHEFDYAIFTYFKSMEDYMVYADHPDHLKFIENYKHLWTTVKVYDTEMMRETGAEI